MKSSSKKSARSGAAVQGSTSTEVRSVTLQARTAADLMTPNPITVSEAANLQEASALLTDMGISAVAVLDREGRPTGVLSRTDIVRHDRETARHLSLAPEFYDQADLTLATGEHLEHGFQVEKGTTTSVGEIMTPDVFSVTPETPAELVVEKMLGLRVHRLFVIDRYGFLVGVISALDVLRSLRA